MNLINNFIIILQNALFVYCSFMYLFQNNFANLILGDKNFLNFKRCKMYHPNSIYYINLFI